ncbi:MAG: KUP/HAK/KT family potassium transporter [Bacteroidales bacterium]|nr:KUP/HAK/KT family potassium transporter [Bacteroidales bacterium]MCF8456197.1 KUP/HAK/KT family potassium transporter [Bacteroidales bacterium]
MKDVIVKRSKLNPLSLSGLIITLGIVYGDIGTSPLYVVKAVFGNLGFYDNGIVLGIASCIFWTLTIQTTLKYVIITLRANNKGEGGIFALYALIRKRNKWAYIIAIIGGSTLLADGIITPSITVTSAIEGLRIVNPEIPTILISVGILTLMFFIQQFGTDFVGRAFGPIMLVWFITIGILGLAQVAGSPEIIKAVNPYYAIKLISHHPLALVILGAVFLATTGAEALYSDLGHCGIRNIRVSWIFVKTMLILNYFGQSAWMLQNTGENTEILNPFFGIMPQWFVVPGIILATMAAIIASQALISGSFTLISEAISLNLWPKLTIKYPTVLKGQLYVPTINIFLWIASTCVILIFKESTAMEAAYGLSISITMLMTTILLVLYLHRIRVHKLLISIVIVLFLFIEGLFFVANLQKFAHGGWFAFIIAVCFSILMYAWYNGRIIKNSLMKYVSMKEISAVLLNIKKDLTIPKFATNLIYLTKVNKEHEIESTIAYSLLDKQPKRADIYWFLHIEILDEPFTADYEIVHVVPGEIIKINLFLGFKVEPRVNLLFMKIRDDLSKANEIQAVSYYPSLKEVSVSGDCRYILIDRILTADHTFNFRELLIMSISDIFRHIAIPESKSFHIDSSNFVLEKVPLGKPDKLIFKLKRRKGK